MSTTHGAAPSAARTDCGRSVGKLIDPVTSDPSKVTCKACHKVPRLAGSGRTLASVDAAPTSGRSLVILESPYAGDLERNLAYARAAMRDSLARNEAPLATHMLYAASGALDDADPEQRAAGIEAGLAWGERAAATVVYQDLDISPGMAEGIAHAKAFSRPVIYRTLPGWLERWEAEHGEATSDG